MTAGSSFFQKIILIGLFVFLGLNLQTCGGKMEHRSNQLVYVGTYTQSDSEGIEIYALNAQTGNLHYLKTAGGIPNPSFLKITPNRRYLYAVNEVLAFHGRPTGSISAFRIDSVSGDLTLLNRVSTGGRAPCYVELSKNGNFLLVNNYLDGTAASFLLKENGQVGKMVSLIHQTGSGPTPKRQESSHIHTIRLDPPNRFAVTANLGTDALTTYAFNAATGELTPVSGGIEHTTPGSGPRHLTFSSDGHQLYVANELRSTVSAFTFAPQTGLLKSFQTITTIPAHFKGENYPADIHMSPDGRFLYVSNRGHDSLAIFSVHRKTGKLTFLTTESVRGFWPRNFTLSANGHLLLVANQKSKTVVSFRRDSHSGRLTWLATTPTKASPACIQIVDF